MDGEWPLTLHGDEPITDDQRQRDEYQANRGSQKELPGGAKKHNRRTKAYLKLLEEKAGESDARN